ncbi:hypothetical protein [Bacillus toyonensis]|uniref:hypothetical protein n=1 Tax=Bacillus toyonensis TaxID=155322 RepID=UPI0015D4AC0C|nr:hypothetical protein [Bacillus toyonensis]
MGIRIYVVEEKAVPKDILEQLFLMIIALWISVFVGKSIYSEDRRYKWSSVDIFGESLI